MKQLTFLILPLLAFVMSCAPIATTQDTAQVRSDFAALQVKFNELQKNQADLYSRSDSSLVTIDSLNAQIQDLQRKISVSNQKVQDLEVMLKNKQLDPSATSVKGLPSDMFQAAYSDFSVGRYELAIAGFESFLAQYASNELAPQAQYYLAESYYAQKKYEKALAEYKKTAKNYPRSKDIVVAANLKTALTYEALGNKQEAIDMYGQILKNYPQSSESLTAREKIRNYKNVQNR
jgi:tol-pal system protein YbgF